jgi:hypothetical protein
MVPGILNRISFKFLFTNPGVTPGFFILRKDNMTDFTKLNDRIVRQAWEFSNLILHEELKTQLFQDKIRRAAEALKARENNPVYFKVNN